MSHYRVRQPTLWALRVVALLHAAVLCSQPVLAGLYLGGELGALSAHEANAGAIAGLALLQVVVALVYCIVGRGRIWPTALSLVLVVAESIQWGLGYDHALHIHLPLGASIVTAQIVFLTWSLRAGSRRARTWRFPWERKEAAELVTADI